MRGLRVVGVPRTSRDSRQRIRIMGEVTPLSGRRGDLVDEGPVVAEG